MKRTGSKRGEGLEVAEERGRAGGIRREGNMLGVGEKGEKKLRVEGEDGQDVEDEREYE